MSHILISYRLPCHVPQDVNLTSINATGVYVQFYILLHSVIPKKPLARGHQILYCKFPKEGDLILKQPSAIWVMKRTNRIILPESFQNKPSVQL